MLSAGVAAEHMYIDDLSVYVFFLTLYLIELSMYDQCYTSVVKCQGFNDKGINPSLLCCCPGATALAGCGGCGRLWASRWATGTSSLARR